MQAVDVRDFEIERRLDAFARARLSPDAQAVARARARVMREARLQVEAARMAAHAVPAVALPRRRSTARRLAMPLLAASMWLGIAVGSVAASQAGGPLYPARLWVEAATLPADAADRAGAEVTRLDARLADALTAAARGDSGGVAAALDAYRQIADETIAAAAGVEDLEGIVGTALDRHRAVLTAVAESLESKGNTTATASVETVIQRAIQHNATVVAAFATNGGGSGGGAPTGPGAGSGSGDDGATGGAGGKGGAAGGSTGGGSGDRDGAGAGSGGNASGDGNGGANAGSGGNGTGNGQDGGNKPDKESKPTPTDDGSTDGGQGENE